MKKTSILLLLTAMPMVLFSQFTVRIWQKADLGTSTSVDGGSVSSWTNQAGSNNPTFTGTGTYNSTTTYAPATFFNYNPSVTFGGAAYMTYPDATVTGLTAANIFYVLRLVEKTALTGPPASPNQWRELHNFGGSTSLYYGYPYNSSGNFYGDDFGATGASLLTDYNHIGSDINTVWDVNYPYLYNTADEGSSFTWTGKNYFNSSDIGNATNESSAPTFASGASNPVMIFMGYNASFTPRPLLTTCSEILMLSGNLTANERSNINTYLALKNGITLLNQPKNYTATNNAAAKWTGGTQLTIWNSATNASYNNNIIGLGRNDIAGLHQKQSKSVNYANSGNLLSISTAALAGTNAGQTTGLASDNSYFMVGDNLGATGSGTAATTDPQIPAGIYAKIGREWLARATNFSQNVTIGFDKTMILNPTFITTTAQLADLRLLVDDDGNFSNATIEPIAATFNPVYPNVIEFVGVTGLGTGSRLYFTLATVSGSTPLPVELSSFTTACEEENVLASWVTASENHSDYFILFGSQDGKEYEEIIRIQAAGMSTDDRYYNYSFRAGSFKYLKLRQVNENGGGIESLPIAVVSNCLPNYEFVLYPNPTGPEEEIHLEYAVNRSEDAQLFIYNSLGQLCGQQELPLQKGDGFVTINKKELKQGIYTLVVRSEFMEIAPLRFVIQ